MSPDHEAGCCPRPARGSARRRSSAWHSRSGRNRASTSVAVGISLGSRPVRRHDLVQAPPVERGVGRAFLIVEPGVDLVVGVRPVQPVVGRFDEAVERHVHQVDQSAHRPHPSLRSRSYSRWWREGTDLPCRRLAPEPGIPQGGSRGPRSRRTRRSDDRDLRDDQGALAGRAVDCEPSADRRRRGPGGHGSPVPREPSAPPTPLSPTSTRSIEPRQSAPTSPWSPTRTWRRSQAPRRRRSTRPPRRRVRIGDRGASSPQREPTSAQPVR